MSSNNKINKDNYGSALQKIFLLQKRQIHTKEGISPQCKSMSNTKSILFVEFPNRMNKNRPFPDQYLKKRGVEHSLTLWEPQQYLRREFEEGEVQKNVTEDIVVMKKFYETKPIVVPKLEQLETINSNKRLVNYHLSSNKERILKGNLRYEISPDVAATTRFKRAFLLSKHNNHSRNSIGSEVKQSRQLLKSVEHSPDRVEQQIIDHMNRHQKKNVFQARLNGQRTTIFQGSRRFNQKPKKSLEQIMNNPTHFYQKRKFETVQTIPHDKKQNALMELRRRNQLRRVYALQQPVQPWRSEEEYNQ